MNFLLRLNRNHEKYCQYNGIAMWYHSYYQFHKFWMAARCKNESKLGMIKWKVTGMSTFHCAVILAYICQYFTNGIDISDSTCRFLNMFITSINAI